MARYVLIRGWLESSFENSAQIRDLVFKHWEMASQYQISEDVANVYKNGWVFPTSPINWISLIFYGAHVKESCIPFIFDCLSKIAGSGLEIEGLFHVDDEEGVDSRLWTIRNDTLLDTRRS